MVSSKDKTFDLRGFPCLVGWVLFVFSSVLKCHIGCSVNSQNVYQAQTGYIINSNTEC